MDKLLVTPTEAAVLIGVGRTTIYSLIARGIIPSVRIGRSVRVPLEPLRNWVDACKDARTPEPSDITQRAANAR
jgi:excisionase family DNA binding protein